MYRRIIILVSLFLGFAMQAQSTVSTDESFSNARSLTTGITLFPNPVAANTSFTIKTQNTYTKTVSIFDLVGNPVQNFKFSTQEYVVNLSKMPTGIYIVKVNVEGKSTTRKLVVQ